MSTHPHSDRPHIPSLPRAKRLSAVGLRIPGSRVAAPLFAAAIFAAVSASPAVAQEGPIVLGKRERPATLTLDPWSGSLDFMAITQFDMNKSAGVSSTSSSVLFQESLTLRSGGGIVSKNFFNWRGSATVGLQENWSEHGAESFSGLGLAHAYNFQGQFLRTTEFPSTFFARRSESYTALSFQPMVKNTNTDYGLTLAYRSPTIPTNISIYHSETEQTQLNGLPNYRLSEDHAEFETVYDPSDRHHLTLKYEFAAIGQENPGSILRNYETQNLYATHDWLLDGTDRYILSQNFSYSDQTGSFPFQYLRLNEQLRMRHTPDLQSTINYSFDQQKFANSLALTHQASAGISHQLFESLTSTAQAGASTTSRQFDATSTTPASDSSTDNLYANLSFNYTKHVPLGILTANLGFGYNRTDNSAVGATQTVLNELHTFTDPLPIILIRPSIDPATIVVFNSNGTRQYLPGIDYTITQSPNRIEINRAFASNIGFNDVVLLNYNVDPLPAYSLVSNTMNTGVRYDFTEGPFKQLGLFAQYFQQDQSTNSLSIRPDQVVDTIIGADYRFWKIIVSLQREDHESTLNSFASTRFIGQYNERLSPRSLLTISATHNFIEYSDLGNTTALTTIDGRMEYQVSRHLKAIALARWRNNDDSRFGNTMGFEEQGELRWDIRQTQIYILLRHNTLLSPGAESTGITAQFGINRSF